MGTRVRRVLYAVVASALVVLCAPTLPQAGAQQPASGRMRLDLDQLSPRVITAATPQVTVSGKITNTGDRRVDGIELRLQRGGNLDSEGALRSALAEPQQTDAIRSPVTSSPFFGVAGSLEPSQSAQFSVTVSLGPERGGLRVDAPGIYPLVANVNGKPDRGGQERLTALSMLMPVLSTPGGAVVPPPPDPSKLALLWPLVDDHPRQVGTAGQDRPVFADDGLATSLSTGGRLFGLVNAVETATTTSTGMLRSLCFAIDPDLLQNVSDMVDGYFVQAGDGEPATGRGGPAAELWLSKVRSLTRGQCVVALPYADADLVALSRAGAIDLQALAMNGSATVARVLDPVKPVEGVVWPASGTLDQRTLADLSSVRRTTVLADPTRLQRAQGTAPFGLGGGASTGTLRAVPYDQLVSSSLDERTVTAGTEGDVRTSSVQNGLATLVFRGAFQGAPGQTVLVAPPRRWTAEPGELAVFLQTVQSLYAGGFATPLDLATVLQGEEQGVAAGLDYAAGDSAAEIPAQVTAEVVRLNAVQRDFRTALQEDDAVKVDPAELVTPLLSSLLRSSSSAWRGRPDQAESSVAGVGRQLDGLLNRVTVTDPGRPLSLASSDSPIPVFITNGLPVTVLAKINLGDTPGLRPEQSTFVRIPPGGAITRYVTAEVTRAGRFSVDVWLSTDAGTSLGGTSRVELTSTSYGNITLAVTGTAAAALVLLVGLRLFRRIRKARAADAGGGAL